MDKIKQFLKDDSWALDLWSEHPMDSNIYFTAKISCTVQARGRYQADGDTIEEAIEKAIEKVKIRWPNT